MADKANFANQFIINLDAPVGVQWVYTYAERTPGLAIAVTHKRIKIFFVYKESSW